MNRTKLSYSLTFLLVLTGITVSVLLLGKWFLAKPTTPVSFRVPGTDGTPKDAAAHRKSVSLAGTFQTFDGTPAATIPGSWTRFRGADSDNIVKDITPLADSWGTDGPQVLWKVELGEGHAAPVVLNGRVYLLDYDETIKGDAIRCFSLADGKEIWRRSYQVSVKRNHGMSRTIPAVTEQYLITMGPRCHVVCLDPASGQYRWGIDLQAEYGTTEPLWYTGQCPLMNETGTQVILAPCGKDVLMMAVDAASGKPVWSTPNPDGWQMSHSSIMPMTIAGKKQYVYCAIGGLIGVSAEPDSAGQVLWKYPWSPKVIAPSPVSLGDGRIFMTAGYGEGGLMIRVSEKGGTYSTETICKYGPKDGLACEQQSPIWRDGLLYGIMPKDAGALRGQFVCMNPDDCKPDGCKPVWTSGQAQRFGLGPFVLADGKFYILDDTGILSMIRVSRDGYQLLASAQVLHGHDAWGPIAVAGNRMLMRDSKEMVCLAVGK